MGKRRLGRLRWQRLRGRPGSRHSAGCVDDLNRRWVRKSLDPDGWLSTMAVIRAILQGSRTMRKSMPEICQATAVFSVATVSIAAPEPPMYTMVEMGHVSGSGPGSVVLAISDATAAGP